MGGTVLGMSKPNALVKPPPYFVSLYALDGLFSAWIGCQNDLRRLKPAGVLLHSTYENFEQDGPGVSQMIRSIPRGPGLPPVQLAWSLACDEGQALDGFQLMRRLTTARYAVASGAVMLVLDFGEKWIGTAVAASPRAAAHTAPPQPGFRADDAIKVIAEIKKEHPKFCVMIAAHSTPKPFVEKILAAGGVDGYISKVHFGAGNVPQDPKRWGAGMVSAGALGLLPPKDAPRITPPSSPARVGVVPVFPSVPGGAAHTVDLLRVADRAPWCVVWTMAPAGHNTMRLDAHGETFLGVLDQLHARGFNGAGRIAKFEADYKVSFEDKSAQAKLAAMNSPRVQAGVLVDGENAEPPAEPAPEPEPEPAVEASEGESAAEPSAEASADAQNPTNGAHAVS